MATIKVFQLDDYEWWAGESLAACVAAGRAECGDECYPDDGTQGEVSASEMRRLKFVYEDGRTLTFAEHLQCEINAGTQFPCPFASLDY